MTRIVLGLVLVAWVGMAAYVLYRVGGRGNVPENRSYIEKSMPGRSSR